MRNWEPKIQQNDSRQNCNLGTFELKWGFEMGTGIGNENENWELEPKLEFGIGNGNWNWEARFKSKLYLKLTFRRSWI